MAERLGTEVIVAEPARRRFDEAWQLITFELDAGRPVIGFNLHGQWDYDLIIGYESADRILHYVNRETRLTQTARAWEQRGPWRVLAMRGYSPRWGQRTLELDGVADMVVRARHPVIDGGCGALGGRAENAIGLAAYRLWAERVLAADHEGDLSKGMRIAWWVDHRRLGVRFLRDIAANHDSAINKRLALAADILQRELEDALLPLAEICPSSDAEDNRRRQRDPEVRKEQSVLMNQAELIQRELVKALEPVVFRHFGLMGESAQVIAMEFDGVYNPQRIALINKMLLSTDARVRTLAALAAARSRNERLTPELRRALLDRDEELAHAALFALRSLKPKGLSSILADAYERSALSRETSGAPDALKRQLVFAASENGDARSMEVLRAAYAGRGHDDAATARWAAEAIARLEGNRAIEGFVRGLEMSERLVVLASIGALRFLHSSRGQLQMERLAESADRDIRFAATEALRALNEIAPVARES